MRLQISSYYTQKKGNNIYEYEDAYYPQINDTKDLDFFKIAIADGASEGFFSSIWANLLVKKFVREDTFIPEEFFKICFHDWQKWKESYLIKREKNNPIQWYEEQGILRGAFSSLLGLTIFQKNSKIYFDVIAIGDTCFFLIRNHRIITSFPIENSNDFNNNPFLIASEKRNIKKIMGNLKTFSSILNPNDWIILATDAFSNWLLKEFEGTNQPIMSLNEISDNDSFNSFINQKRDDGNMKNDDVTFILINIQES